MNKTVTMGTLVIILLVIGSFATSALAINYYQAATQATIRATALEAKGKELTGQLTQTNKTLQDTRAQFQDALGRLGITQEQLKATQGQLGKTQGQLGQTQGQLGKTQGQLKATQGTLGQTQSQLSQIQQENQRRLQMIFAQQENVKILKACLAGTVVSQDYYNKGMDHYLAWIEKPNNFDYEEAIRNFKKATAIMEPVKNDCDRAYALFK